MHKFMDYLIKFKQNEQGGLVEYVLLAMFIALAAIASMTLIAPKISTIMTSATTAL